MGKFEKGHKKIAGRKKGTKDKVTIVKETFGIKTIEELKDSVLENWREYLSHNNDNYKLTATKEVSKYLFATKKEINLGLNELELEMLRQAAAEKMKEAL